MFRGLTGTFLTCMFFSRETFPSKRREVMERHGPNKGNLLQEDQCIRLMNQYTKRHFLFRDDNSEMMILCLREQRDKSTVNGLTL